MQQLLDYPSTRNRDYLNSILIHYPGWESYDQTPSDLKVGWIYFAVDIDLRICKIGFSKQPQKRVSKLKKPLECRGPKLKIIKQYRATLKEELRLHKLMSKYRIDTDETATKVDGKNEWYRYEGLIIDLAS